MPDRYEQVRRLVTGGATAETQQGIKGGARRPSDREFSSRSGKYFRFGQQFKRTTDSLEILRGPFPEARAAFNPFSRNPWVSRLPCNGVARKEFRDKIAKPERVKCFDIVVGVGNRIGRVVRMPQQPSPAQVSWSFDDDHLYFRPRLSQSRGTCPHAQGNQDQIVLLPTAGLDARSQEGIVSQCRISAG